MLETVEITFFFDRHRSFVYSLICCIFTRRFFDYFDLFVVCFRFQSNLSRFQPSEFPFILFIMPDYNFQPIWNPGLNLVCFFFFFVNLHWFFFFLHPHRNLRPTTTSNLCILNASLNLVLFFFFQIQSHPGSDDVVADIIISKLRNTRGIKFVEIAKVSAVVFLFSFSPVDCPLICSRRMPRLFAFAVCVRMSFFVLLWL